jgi:hypothetical protein
LVQLIALAVVVACTRTGSAPSGTLLTLVNDVPLPGGSTRFDYQEIDSEKGQLVIAHMNDDAVLDPRRGHWESPTRASFCPDPGQLCNYVRLSDTPDSSKWRADQDDVVKTTDVSWTSSFYASCPLEVA